MISLRGIAVLLLVVAVATANFNYTLEDVLSIPSSHFLGVGSRGSAALSLLDGKCVSELIVGGFLDPAQDPSQGVVHRFQRRTELFWNDLGEIASAYPLGSTGDQYGRVVAGAEMSGDSYIAIGAPDASTSGAVDLFRLDLVNDEYEHIATLMVPTGVPSTDRFGAAVALGDDMMLIGDPEHANGDGLIVFYDVVGANVTVKLLYTGTTSGLNGGKVGSSLDIYDGYAVSGFPALAASGGGVVIFDLSSGAQTVATPVLGSTQAIDVNDNCGASVLLAPGFLPILSPDPVNVFVGCPSASAVAVATLDGDMTNSNVMKPPASFENSGMGWSLARRDDPDFPGEILVGAPLRNGGQGSIIRGRYEPILEKYVVDIADVIDSPGGIVERFGEDIVSRFPYIAVGCPTNALASTTPPSSRNSCPLYSMSLAGIAPGTEVTTIPMNEDGGSGVMSMDVETTWTFGHHPVVVFDTNNPNSRAEFLGTPNEAYGGPGEGSGGVDPEHTNDVNLGNALIVAMTSPSSDPRPFFGAIDITFSESVVLETVTIVNPLVLTLVKSYNADGDLLGKDWLPWSRVNAVVVEQIFRPNVRRIKVILPGAGAVAGITVRPCFGGVVTTGGSSSGGGSGTGGDGTSGHYYVFRDGPADPTCDLGVLSPAASTASLLSTLF